MPVTTSRKKSNGQVPQQWPDEDVSEYELVIAGGVVRGVDLGPLRGVIDPDDFADLKLGAVVRAGLRLEAEGQPRDNVTLGGELRKMPRGLNDGGTWFDLVGSATLINLFNACPSELAFPAYVERLADVIDRRKGGLVVERQLRIEVKRAGLGYEAAVQSGVTLRVDRLRESHGELSGELSVRWTSPRRVEDGHIYRGRFNLGSLTARSSTARFLSDATRGSEVPWAKVLERFCVAVLDAHRAGDAFQLVGQLPPRAAPARLLHPILPADAATLLYARAGTGKSTLAAAIALSIQTGIEVVPGWKPLSAPVLYLDWEASAGELNDRIAGLAAGIGIAPPNIHYRRMDGSLAGRVEEMAAFVCAHGIGLVVVDSVGMAAGTARDGSDANESALRLFDALRAIGGTSLLIDHVAGAELDRSGAIAKSYGSIYKVNLARAAYELRRENEGTQERTELVLRQAKVNDSARLAPITLAITYSRSGEIRIETTRATAPELFQLSMSTSGRIAAFLGTGAAAAPSIAEQLGLSRDLVRQTLHRHQGRTFIKLHDGNWGLAANA